MKRKVVHSVLADEAEPRAAAHIAMLLEISTDAALYHLRTLEAEGQVTHKADEAGVIRWSLVPEETGAAMELGAEVYFAGHYEPSPEQRGSLGL